MGNRAVITGDKHHKLGLYLHWNGGPESVLAFLHAARDLGMHNLDSNPEYGLARLAQVVGNFFGGDNSMGVGLLESLDRDNGNNGTYYVDEDWRIARRTHVDNAAAQITTVRDLSADDCWTYHLIYEDIMRQYRKGYWGESVLNVVEAEAGIETEPAR